MNRHLTTIGAVLRKDWILLWPLVLVNAGLLCLMMYSTQQDLAGPKLVQRIMMFSPFAAILSSVVLSFAVAQQDPIPGIRQDWLTRPLPRLDLIGAKLIFLMGAILAPVAIGAFVISVTNGHSLAEVATQMSTDFIIFLLFPIILAFTSLTANLVEGLVAALGGIVLFVAAPTLAMALSPQLSATNGLVSDSGFSWVAEDTGFWVLVIGAFVVLWLQYGLRRTNTSRIFAVVGAFVTGGLMFFFPWDTAIAVHAAVRGSATPAPMAIRVGDQCPKAPAAPPRRVTVPFEIDGVPAGWRLVVDRMERVADQPGMLLAGMGKNYPKITDGRWSLDRQVPFENDKAGRVMPVDLDATLSLLAPNGSFEVPLDGRRRRIPGLGWCGIKPKDNSRQLSCMTVGRERVEAYVGGLKLDCANCATGAYAPGGREVRTQAWWVPPMAAGETATIKAFRYRSTATAQVSLPGEALMKFAAQCPTAGPKSPTNAAISTTLTLGLPG